MTTGKSSVPDDLDDPGGPGPITADVDTPRPLAFLARKYQQRMHGIKAAEELEAEIARLRARTHELQEAHDRRYAALEQEIAHWRRALANTDALLKDDGLAFESMRVRAVVASLLQQQERLAAVATAAAWLYLALAQHRIAVHRQPAPAPVLPLTGLYEALIAAGYTRDGETVDPEQRP